MFNLMVFSPRLRVSAVKIHPSHQAIPLILTRSPKITDSMGWEVEMPA
jgi:hypothetical protein